MRAQIAGLYLKGRSQRDMAAQMGVSRDIIRYDLDAIRENWKKSALFDFNEAVGKQLARLDMAESEAWDAWEKSKTNRSVTVTRQRRRTLPSASDAVLDNVSEAMKRDEQRDADPRYLQIALDCIKERNKILGLYAPDELRGAAAGGGERAPIAEVFYEAIPDMAGDAHVVVLGAGEGASSNGQLSASALPEPPDEDEQE